MKRYLWFPFFLLVMVCAAGQRGLPVREGIRNFGKVSDELYRGAQPDEEGIRNLKRLGIKSIVNLRTSEGIGKAEVALAEAGGILCTNIPLNGMRRPNPEQLRQVLATIKALPGPVFVHCRHGCDRTGTIVACYRIEYQKWSNEAAFAEAEHYGISKLERGMRKLIREYGKQPQRRATESARIRPPKLHPPKTL